LWPKETHLRESDIPSFSTIRAEHMPSKGLLGKVAAHVADSVAQHDLKNLYGKAI
jgi:hypothetical protein